MSRSPSTKRAKPKRLVNLCPAAEKIVADIPPYMGLTGGALRWLVKKCIRAQRKYDAKH